MVFQEEEGHLYLGTVTYATGCYRSLSTIILLLPPRAFLPPVHLLWPSRHRSCTISGFLLLKRINAEKNIDKDKNLLLTVSYYYYYFFYKSINLHDRVCNNNFRNRSDSIRKE